MLKCKEISALVSTDDLDNAGFMKKVEVRMHLLMCKHCARYFDQIKSVGKGAKDLALNQEAHMEQIERMEKHILEEVRDNSSDK
jgi:hypothetical protein